MYFSNNFLPNSLDSSSTGYASFSRSKDATIQPPAFTNLPPLHSPKSLPHRRNQESRSPRLLRHRRPSFPQSVHPSNALSRSRLAGPLAKRTGLATSRGSTPPIFPLDRPNLPRRRQISSPIVAPPPQSSLRLLLSSQTRNTPPPN